MIHRLLPLSEGRGRRSICLTRVPEPDFDDLPGEVYHASGQAGPGNDINAGSLGAQKAPTWSPASLVTVWVSPTAFEI
jgi:hypothetical protein